MLIGIGWHWKFCLFLTWTPSAVFQISLLKYLLHRKDRVVWTKTNWESNKGSLHTKNKNAVILNYKNPWYLTLYNQRGGKQVIKYTIALHYYLFQFKNHSKVLPSFVVLCIVVVTWTLFGTSQTKKKYKTLRVGAKTIPEMKNEPTLATYALWFG